MNAFSRRISLPLGAALIVAVGVFGAYPCSAGAEEIIATLSGKQEVPPVDVTGTGSATIAVDADKSVSGSVTTTGVAGIAAHIHEGAAGRNGPIIIPLVKGDNGTWKVPAGAKLSDAQYAAFRSGNLYVNVHTKAHPGGEVRAQLKP